MRPVLLGAIAGSGGGGGYIAPAVHFDGATSARCASLTATDNTSLSCSYWIKLDEQDVPGVQPYNTVWAVDPADTYPSWGEHLMVSGGAAEAGVTGFVGNGANNVALLYNNDATAGLDTGVWYHILYVIRTIKDVSQDAEVVLYLNDVLTSQFRAEAGDTTFNQLWNGLPLWIGDDDFEGGGLIGDLADLWVAPGVDISEGIDGITIPEATRRLFISAEGKPVDPSGFPASAVLLSGTASTFATNQGSGGTFTTTGTLTNASTSPSD